jgi:hypothetical protein
MILIEHLALLIGQLYGMKAHAQTVPYSLSKTVAGGRLFSSSDNLKSIHVSICRWKDCRYPAVPSHVDNLFATVQQDGNLISVAIKRPLGLMFY